MPDLTTPAGREELRLDATAVLQSFPEQSVIGRLVRGCLALLDQADAGEREWRPISSAPKDGTQVLGWADEHGGGCHLIVWRSGLWWRVNGHGITPTHWMPLPPPPARAAAEET